MDNIRDKLSFFEALSGKPSRFNRALKTTANVAPSPISSPEAKEEPLRRSRKSIAVNKSIESPIVEKKTKHIDDMTVTYVVPLRKDKDESPASPSTNTTFPVHERHRSSRPKSPVVNDTDNVNILELFNKVHSHVQHLVEQNENYQQMTNNQFRLNRKIEKLKKKLEASENQRKDSEQNFAVILSSLQSENISLHKSLQDAEKKYKKLEESIECALCYDERATIVFEPCHHQAYCAKCNTKHKPTNCPVCRARIDSSFRVYNN